MRFFQLGRPMVEIVRSSRRKPGVRGTRLLSGLRFGLSYGERSVFPEFPSRISPNKNSLTDFPQFIKRGSERARQVGVCHGAGNIFGLHPKIHFVKFLVRRPGRQSNLSHKRFQVDAATFAFVDPFVKGIQFVQWLTMSEIV